MLEDKDNNNSVDLNDEKVVKIIENMLQSVGITHSDPIVINKLINLTCDHVINILENAKEFSKHANKNKIDTADVILALKMRKENDVVPFSKEVLNELVMETNSTPLPEIKQQDGLLLPPEKYCLSATNYKLISKPKMNPIIITQFPQNTSLLIPTRNENTISRTIVKRAKTINFPEQRIVFRPNLKINIKPNIENQSEFKKSRMN